MSSPSSSIAGWRPAPRVLWLSAGAVLLYGALAAAANQAHGPGPMWRAALVQGLSCGVTTFGLSNLIDLLLAWLLGRRWPPRAAAAGSALAAAMSSASLHVVANLAAGTPELLATVAAPVGIGLGFCVLYAGAALRRMAPAPAARLA